MHSLVNSKEAGKKSANIFLFFTTLPPSPLIGTELFAMLILR